MRFEWHPNLDMGGCALTAIAEDYDGYPAPSSLMMDFSPRFASPGRLAAAAVLAFRPFISGAATFPHGIAPELARSISEFLSPATTFPGPLEFHPKEMPLGTGVFQVEAPDTPGEAVNDRPNEGVSRLRLSSSGQDFGHLFAPTVTTVPTNATLLSPQSDDALVRLMPHIAAAVLLAEDFGIGTLRLPGASRPSVLSERVGDLLQSSGLTVEFAS